MSATDYSDAVEILVELRPNGTWRFVKREPDEKVLRVRIRGDLPSTDGSGVDVYGRPYT